MKHILLFITLLIGSFSFAYAQEDEADPVKREQKIQALYVAYITQQLNLTPAEAEKFWPLHKQFDSELKSSVDINKPELDKQQAVLDIKKKYQDKFSKILGNNRTDDFFRKDMEFRKKLVDRLRKLRQQNNSNQRPPRRNN
ncbi:MAG: hypothetical protein ABIO04_05255 [Ferruginibacter sp.]